MKNMPGRPSACPATKVAWLTREDLIWIVDTHMLDANDTDLVLNAAATILEFEDDCERGCEDPSSTKPFVVSQQQAENLVDKFKIAGPAQRLALIMWRLVLQWRRGFDTPEFPDANPADDVAYKPGWTRSYAD